MKIKRTSASNRPLTSVFLIEDYLGGGTNAVTDVIHEGMYPTHSQVLDSTGKPLEYEPRQKIGFKITP